MPFSIERSYKVALDSSEGTLAKNKTRNCQVFYFALRLFVQALGGRAIPILQMRTPRHRKVPAANRGFTLAPRLWTERSARNMRFTSAL